ncbi:MAG: PilZ domain-containing protein [Fimbriimonas sp.]
MPTSRIDEGVIDARVTLQRLTDAKIVHGWVTEFGVTLLMARLNGNLTIGPGETFACRVYREGGDLMFNAVARSAEAGLFRFGVVGQVAVLSTQGDARYARDLPASIDNLSVHVCDVSANGIGLIAPVPYRPGAELTVTLEGMEVRGEIRYCRPLREQASSYRLGIRLAPMGRIDRARWSEIVTSARDGFTEGPNRLTA